MILKIKGELITHLHDEMLERELTEILPDGKQILRWSNIEYDNMNEVWVLTVLGTGDEHCFTTREAALTFERWLYSQTNMEGQRCEKPLKTT